MKIFLDCDRRFSRPVVAVDSLFPGCMALIDTGALFPVWTAPEESLLDLGVSLDTKLSRGKISGIGGSAYGNIYRITFDLNGVNYIDLPIIAIRHEKSPFHLLLPSTIFSGMEVDINYAVPSVCIETNSNQVVYHLHHKLDEDDEIVLING